MMSRCRLLLVSFGFLALILGYCFLCAMLLGLGARAPGDPGSVALDVTRLRAPLVPTAVVAFGAYAAWLGSMLVYIRREGLARWASTRGVEGIVFLLGAPLLAYALVLLLADVPSTVAWFGLDEAWTMTEWSVARQFLAMCAALGLAVFRTLATPEFLTLGLTRVLGVRKRRRADHEGWTPGPKSRPAAGALGLMLCALVGTFPLLYLWGMAH